MTEPQHSPATPGGGATRTPIHEIKAELFRALAHPARVRVLELLGQGERAVSDLLSVTGLEASHLSQHLGVLRRAGVVLAQRQGNTVTYRLSHPSLAGLLSAARDFLMATLSSTRAALTELEASPAHVVPTGARRVRR